MLAAFDWRWAFQIGLLVFTAGVVVFAAYCAWDNTKYLNRLKRERDNRNRENNRKL